MFPPLFALASADASVTALLGTDPVRFWPFAEARQDESRPYAVWQVTYGAPDNLLGEVPRMDRHGVLVDAYATTATVARDIAEALRNALETSCYVVSWNGEFKDVATGLFRYSFTVEFMTAR